MKHFALLLFIFPAVLFAQPYTVSVKMEKLKSNDGRILLELYNEKQEVVSRHRADINNKTAQFELEITTAGKYGIRFFHDENNNTELDFSWYGPPKEGYGYSNNVQGTMGEPAFKNWLFDVQKDTVINLITRY